MLNVVYLRGIVYVFTNHNGQLINDPTSNSVGSRVDDSAGIGLVKINFFLFVAAVECDPFSERKKPRVVLKSPKLERRQKSQKK